MVFSPKKSETSPFAGSSPAGVEVLTALCLLGARWRSVGCSVTLPAGPVAGAVPAFEMLALGRAGDAESGLAQGVRVVEGSNHYEGVPVAIAVAVKSHAGQGPGGHLQSVGAAVCLMHGGLR